MPTPLDVMLEMMNRRWAQGDEDGAVQLAKAAAPYVHPRATARGLMDLASMGDDELDAFGGRGGESVASCHPG